MFFLKIFYWILFILAGMGIIKYRKVVHSWTGAFAWAEHYLWYGGTYLVLILTWLAFIFYWVIFPMWWIEFMLWR